MHSKKHLQFSALRKSLSEHFRAIDDKRQNGKIDHQLHDCLMAAFAMMLFQDASLLEFQRRLEIKSNLSNLKTVFQVQSVPKDSQLKSTLDQIDTNHLFGIFSDWFQRLQPRKRHPKLPIIITGDGLYSKQPFIDVLKQNRMSYILVAKQDDHKILFEWVRELQGLGDGGSLELFDDKGRKHRYQWINNVPLNGSKDADKVNFFEYELTPQNKVTYRNSWVTDIPVDENNVVELVKGGRARWKIENETFNTLKNKGYHI